MLILRDLKDQKVGPHPPSTIHLPPPTPKIKKKVSVLKSQILIKYKKIQLDP